jgi:hypothetical protein
MERCTIGADPDGGPFPAGDRRRNPIRSLEREEPTVRTRHPAIVLLLPLLLAGTWSCRPAAPAATPVPAGPRPDQGIVTFMSGASFKSEGSDWAELDIGSLLESGDAVKTAEQAFCEIQFGTTAVVRLEGSSVVMIDEILAEIGSARINVRLVAGSVLCKVQQLASVERFRVRTRSAICGVRGTEFGVTSETDGSTRLYVKSGAVTFTPLAADPDRIGAAIPEAKRGAFEEVVEEIDEIAPVVVTADQEARLTADAQNVAEAAMKVVEERITRAVEQVAEAPEGQAAELPPEVEAEITRAVMQVAVRLSQDAGKTAPVSDASRRSLAPLDRMKILEQLDVPPAAEAPRTGAGSQAPVVTQAEAEAVDPEGGMLRQPAEQRPAAPLPSARAPEEQPPLEQPVAEQRPAQQRSSEQRPGDQQPAQRRPELTKVAIQVDPPDAAIFLASGYIAAGSFAGYFEVTVPFVVSFERENYAPQTLRIVPAKDAQNLHRIKLEPLPQPTAAVEQITVSAVPSGADILLDGRRMGTGSFTAAYALGTVLQFEVRKEGYVPGTLALTVTKGMQKAHTVSLARRKESVEIAVTPQDAEIVGAGKVIGKGAWSGEAPVGSALAFTIRRLGYESRDVAVVVKEGGSSAVAVELEPRPVLWRLASVVPSGATPAWRMAADDDAFYLADSRGSVHAVSRSGAVRWSVTTANAPNENSVPVMAGQRIGFTGGSEMVAIDRRTGRVEARRALQGDASHIFGRRVLPLADGLLVPEENALVVTDAGGAASSRRVAIPAGSQMSPAAWGGSVLIADKEGTLLVYAASGLAMEAEVATDAVQPVAIAATVVGDRAYFADRKGLAVCVDLAARKTVWQRRLDEGKSVGIFQDLAVDGSVVCAYAKSTLYLLSAASGAPLYTPITGVSAPAALDSGQLVYGTADGSLKIANAGTGKVVKSLALGARVAAQPLVVGDRIALALANGDLLVVYPQSIR